MWAFKATLTSSSSSSSSSESHSWRLLLTGVWLLRLGSWVSDRNLHPAARWEGGQVSARISEAGATPVSLEERQLRC